MRTGFIYYLPGVKGKITDAITAHGLDYAIDGAPAVREVTKGPFDQGAGTLVAHGDALPAFHPDAQTWRRIPGSKVCIGYEEEALPTPAMLKREKVQFNVYRYELADGQEWQCPTVINEKRETELPCTYDIDEDGKVIRRHDKKYDPLLIMAHEHRDAMERTTEVEIENEFAMVGAALQCTYRVSSIECGILGIVDNLAIARVLFALVDFPSWSEHSEE